MTRKCPTVTGHVSRSFIYFSRGRLFPFPLLHRYHRPPCHLAPRFTFFVVIVGDTVLYTEEEEEEAKESMINDNV